MTTEEKPRLHTPANLMAIMGRCEDLLRTAVAIAPALDGDDPDATAVYEKTVADARVVEAVLQADALRDCAPPSWLDMESPSDRYSLAQRPDGLPIELAARQALFVVGEWRAWVSACGVDGAADAYKPLEQAWLKLVMLRLVAENPEVKLHEEANAM